MNLASMMTRPLVISTPGEATEEDPDYGTPIPGAATEATVLGYVEQRSTQGSTNEITVGQQTAPGSWWAALPAGTPVKATSTLTIPDSGQTFQVSGEPEEKWNPWDRRIEYVRVELEAET